MATEQRLGIFSHFFYTRYSKSEHTAQLCHNLVTTLSQGCHKVVTVSITKLFQACHKAATRLPQGYYGNLVATLRPFHMPTPPPIRLEILTSLTHWLVFPLAAGPDDGSACTQPIPELLGGTSEPPTHRNQYSPSPLQPEELKEG